MVNLGFLRRSQVVKDFFICLMSSNFSAFLRQIKVERVLESPWSIWACFTVADRVRVDKSESGNTLKEIDKT